MRDSEIDLLKVGSVIRSKKGVLRVVRRVAHYDRFKSPKYGPENVHSVTCTINRCSWTGRPDTILLRADLRLLYEYTGIVVKDMDTPFQAEFLKNVHAHQKDITISCCAATCIP